jgi:hypothetical protein
MIRPTDTKVDQHGTSIPHNSLNCTFGNTILMVGANTGQPITLIEILQMIDKFSGSKDSIVAVVGGSSNSMIKKDGFEKGFGPDGVRSG